MSSPSVPRMNLHRRCRQPMGPLNAGYGRDDFRIESSQCASLSIAVSPLAFQGGHSQPNLSSFAMCNIQPICWLGFVHSPAGTNLLTNRVLRAHGTPLRRVLQQGTGSQRLNQATSGNGLAGNDLRRRTSTTGSNI